MLNAIRNLVYTLGFRPKYGSMLYSASRDRTDIFDHIEFSVKHNYAKAILENLANKKLSLGDECPECNSWIHNGTQWIRVRKTTDLVCLRCGTDYGQDIR